MVDWTASEQCKEISELKTNSIELQCSLNEKGEIVLSSHAEPRLQRILGEGTLAANSGNAQNCGVFSGSRGKKTRNLEGVGTYSLEYFESQPRLWSELKQMQRCRFLTPRCF